MRFTALLLVKHQGLSLMLYVKITQPFHVIAVVAGGRTTSEELISGSLFVDSPDKFRILCFFFYFGISFAVHHHCSYKYTLVIFIWTLLLMSTSSLNTIIQLYKGYSESVYMNSNALCRMRPSLNHRSVV